jgi:hypothetical protein
MSDRRQQRDRRAAADRRRSDRRRKGDTRVFVIELTEQELRLAMLERASAAGGVDQVSAWTTRWRKEAVALETPEGAAELSAALREVARRHNMFTAEVRIVLSGEFCVTRTVRGTVEEVRQELKQLEQRSRLYLSLGPGEKVLVTHTRLLDARHAHGLAAACNKETLRAIQAAAEHAGLEVSTIEPALSALARASSRLPDVPAEPYLLLQVSEASTEIGICHDSQLLLDYRPGGTSDVTQLPALLVSHLNRLNRHVSRYVRASTGGLKLALLCGDKAVVQKALKQFSSMSPLEVRAVRSADIRATWKLHDSAVEEVTAPALGNLLLSYLPADEIDAPNFMQHIYEGRQEPLRPRVIASVIPIAATLLVALALAWTNIRARTNLEATRAELGSLASASARATELRQQLIASDVKLRELEKLAAKLPGDLPDEKIRRLGQCMPSDVWLSQLLVVDAHKVSIHGASYLEAGVYDFVRWLELAPGFNEVALKRTSAASTATGPTTTFEVELSLEDFNEQATRVARHD